MKIRAVGLTSAASMMAVQVMVKIIMAMKFIDSTTVKPNPLSIDGHRKTIISETSSIEMRRESDFCKKFIVCFGFSYDQCSLHKACLSILMIQNCVVIWFLCCGAFAYVCVR